jgi:CO/xanthine dehydrogenase FAD-binding subunit
MLAYDFDYYLPDTVREAADIYAYVKKAGKQPYYYGGGTEIISMARVFSLKPDAVIDIKNIPDCRELGTDGERLVFGAARTLSDVSEAGLFPLLGLAGARIADHTIQVKLTLGGNLAGTIYYHETLPPLLICDSLITLADADGDMRDVPIADVLDADRGLKPGELLVKVSLDRRFAEVPYAHIKKAQSEKIGYPLISVSSVLYGDTIRLAASGLCAYPLRLPDIPLGKNAYEASLQAVCGIGKPILDDASGSAPYRQFILRRTVEKIIRGFHIKEG